MIYISSPYTHPDMTVRQARHDLACAYTACLMQRGKEAISPIAHSHALALVHELPHDINYWHKWNHLLLRQCCEIHYLQMPGWESSVGMAFERGVAMCRGLEFKDISWDKLKDKYSEARRLAEMC